MALTDNTQISTIATALGNADANFQADLNLGNGSSAISYIKVARQTVMTQAANGGTADTDFDLQNPLFTALRNTEKGLPGMFNPILNNSVNALDTYFTAEMGTPLRTYFNGKTTQKTVSWTDNFRALWRRVKSSELIISIGNITATSGPSWGTTLSNTHSIVLDSGLEVRTNPNAAIGSAAIVVSMVLVHASGSTEMASVTIPANSVAGTVIPIVSSVNGSTNKFVSVQSLSITGGTSGDEFDVWVAQ